MSTSCMKNYLLRIFFEWALIASVLMSIMFFLGYYITSHAARATKANILYAQAHFQGNHNAMGLLLAECREYAKTNADMARLLDSGKTQAPATAPATSPKTRTK